MVDTDSDLPSSSGTYSDLSGIDTEAFLGLQETIRNLGKGYRMSGGMDIDECSSNLAQPIAPPL